ncbi:hypothetical protein KXD98_13900 [Mycobacterium sp. SMC-4]|nr:hypothetical protein KXD98_13900 [Mycobacterium sp. SMC-4]
MHAFRYAGLPVIVLTAVACSGPTVITTEDATYTPVPTSTAAPETTAAGNAHLVNAFDFAAEVDGQTGYYFTSPSGRWACAIEPRVRAGCQNAQSPHRIGVTAAPAEVPRPNGTLAAPNAIVVERDAEPRFVPLDTPAFGLDADAEPATVLPFNRILAVAGFRCNVQETVGISCLSELSGQGFTFSADTLRLHYTDVPADAV